MSHLSSLFKTASGVALTVSMLTLAACSGGGGGGSAPAAATPATAAGAMPADSLFQATKASPDMTSVKGTWNFKPLEVQEGDFSTSARIKIEDGRLTSELRCTDQASGHVMYARTSSPIVMTDRTIQVLEAHEDQKTEKVGDQNMNCNASVKQATVPYAVRDGKLFFGLDAEGEANDVVADAKFTN